MRTRIVRKFGGGGGQSETHSTIPTWMRPYLESGLQRAQSAEASGALSRVAGATADTKLGQDVARSAAGAQQGVAGNTLGALGQLSKVAAGEEIVPSSTGATNAIKQATIREAQKGLQPTIANRAKANAVGGGRQILGDMEAENDLNAKLAGIDYQDLQARRQAATGAASAAISGGAAAQDQLVEAANTLKGVGTDIQKQNQAEADAEFQGLSRYASLVSGTPWQSEQQKQQGGK